MRRANRLVPVVVMVLFWAVQIVRVTHGVDFNDEMQYYGQLSGLVTSGRLFSNDLFVQQAVYVLVYPVFRLSTLVLGSTGLILLGRAVFALFLSWVFRQTRRALAIAGVPPAAAAIAALSVSFAVPLYNIYAITYNTIGLGLLAACFGELIAWRSDAPRVRVRWWAIVLLIMAVTHPPLAIVTGAVVGARLITERDWISLRHGAITIAGGGLALALILLPLSSPADLRAAARFSSAFNSQPVVADPIGLISVLGIAAAAALVTQWRFELAAALNRLAPVAVIALLYSGGLAARWWWNAIGWLGGMANVLSALVATSWPEPDRARRRAWLTVLFVATAALMALTSSNGVNQIQGPASLLAPFLAALALSPSPKPLRLRSSAGWIVSVSVLIAMIAHWAGNPYRDGTLLQQHVYVTDAPAFRGLAMTQAKADAIREARTTLGDIPARSRVMVLGAQPWLYFATDTQPDTDMIFMHSAGRPAAFELLSARLAARRPDFIVAAAAVPPAVRLAFEALARNGTYLCNTRTVGPAMRDAIAQLQTFYEFSPQITVCRYARPAG